MNQTVTSPRARSPRSYAGQFPTRYLFLYLGFTLLDFVEAMASLPPRHGTPEPATQGIHAPTPRAGDSPLSGDIGALSGYVGKDPKPALKKFIAKNDSAGLKRYVARQAFIDALVYTRLVTVISGIPFFVKKPSGFAHDPAQITDLAYLAAVNAVILQEAFTVAADVASRTRKPLSSVWGEATYQSEVMSFVTSFMAVVRSNKTAGAAALGKVVSQP